MVIDSELLSRASFTALTCGVMATSRVAAMRGRAMAHAEWRMLIMRFKAINSGGIHCNRGTLRASRCHLVVGTETGHG
jgi:hypothetical protein